MINHKDKPPDHEVIAQLKAAQDLLDNSSVYLTENYSLPTCRVTLPAASVYITNCKTTGDIWLRHIPCNQHDKQLPPAEIITRRYPFVRPQPLTLCFVITTKGVRDSYQIKNSII
ncbi:unnamed protein product [Fusarium graminearum]|nr:unnamed protein product [Fusarium graminearum]